VRRDATIISAKIISGALLSFLPGGTRSLISTRLQPGGIGGGGQNGFNRLPRPELPRVSTQAVETARAGAGPSHGAEARY